MEHSVTVEEPTPDGIMRGLRLPIVAAPMFLISGVDLVVSACSAGVVGAFPAPNCRTTDELDQWMGTIDDRLRAREAAGGRVAPWAVNMVTHRSNARLADDLRLLKSHEPPIVITALGSPAPVMEVVKDYGGMVIADVVDLRLARKAVEVGVDGLACVAAGAGGHTGKLSPFAFVAAVREIFEGLVVVGGGISTGAGVAGAVAAGADLIYMGTRFLTAQESLAPRAYKQMVVDHGPDDLVVTAAVTGTGASWLRPSLIANGLDPDTRTKPVNRDYNSAGDAGRRWKDLWAAGQGLGSIHAIEPVEAIVDDIELGFRAALERVHTTHGAPA